MPRRVLPVFPQRVTRKPEGEHPTTSLWVSSAGRLVWISNGFKYTGTIRKGKWYTIVEIISVLIEEVIEKISNL